MSRYVTDYGIFTKEGWSRIEEFFNTEKMNTFVDELSPLERYALIDVVSSEMSMAILIQNSLESMKEEIHKREEE